MGACPSIEVEIDVTDKSSFFIRLYHVKEEDKNILDNKMKRLYYLGILNEGFPAYWKVTKDVSVIKSRKQKTTHSTLTRQ